MTGCLSSFFDGKKILVVGFGREGRSTLRFIENHCKKAIIGLADRERKAFSQQKIGHTTYIGDQYPGPADQYDMAVVSPGIDRVTVDLLKRSGVMVTSQTDLFLRCYRDMTTGITGTKGKSTTSTLLHRIFSEGGKESFLVGNIGSPAFDVAGMLSRSSKVVYEMSSSQLETITSGPGSAILLNLYPEHLDRYPDLPEYYRTKARIMLLQQAGDISILPYGNEEVDRFLGGIARNRESYRFSSHQPVERGSFIKNDAIVFRNDGVESIVHEDVKKLLLPGRHNHENILAAVTAAMTAGTGISQIRSALQDFRGLQHRLEYVGKFDGIIYYNDSISTIPQSCIRALESVAQVDTLLLGGFDRGLDYAELYEYLAASEVRNILFMGPAGTRMIREYRKKAPETQKLIESGTLEEAVLFARENTRKEHVCLLSPAAASYDRFRNFEERGTLYKKLARNL